MIFSNGFVERMVGVAKELMDKAGKEGKPWISGLYDYRVTPVRQYCMTIAISDTVHTKGEKSALTSKHSRHPRNVSNSTETHEEAREQTRKELH